MANEWVCIEKPTMIVRRTIADGTAIAKGTALKLTDPNTALAATDSTPFAGVTIEEKTVSDGIVEIGAALDGVWDAKDSGAGITVGTAVRLSANNLIVTAVAADLLSGAFAGVAEETASASEVIRVRLRGY